MVGRPIEPLIAAVKTTVLKSARTGGLSIISRLNANFGAGTGAVVTGGTFGFTQRIAHKNLTGKQVISAAPVFAHYAPAGSTEANTPQDYMIKVALEPFGTPTVQSNPWTVFINGQSTYTLAKRGVISADEMPINWTANTVIFERTGITTATTGGTIGRHQIALGGTSGWGKDTGEGGVAADNVTSGTMSNNTVAGYSASLMLGRLQDGTIAPSINIIGDSKAIATDDQEFGPNAGGWCFRSCSLFPGGNFAIAGEKLRDTLTGSQFQTRFALSRFSTHILDEYGTNDVLAADSVATIKANILASAYRFMVRGQNYIKATVPPLTDSTNGWYDTAGQTVRANEAIRTAVNDWIRNQTATGFTVQANAQVAGITYAGWADFVDPCLATEVNAGGILTLNGGFWAGTQSVIIASGTATAGSTTTVTTSGLTANALKGYVIHIVSGTGAGQVRSVQQNTTTVITVGNAFATAPDATSVFRVFDGNTIDGTHESTGGHVREAYAVQFKIISLMARP